MFPISRFISNIRYMLLFYSPSSLQDPDRKGKSRENPVFSLTDSPHFIIFSALAICLPSHSSFPLISFLEEGLDMSTSPNLDPPARLLKAQKLHVSCLAYANDTLALERYECQPIAQKHSVIYGGPVHLVRSPDFRMAC